MIYEVVCERGHVSLEPEEDNQIPPLGVRRCRAKIPYLRQDGDLMLVPCGGMFEKSKILPRVVYRNRGDGLPQCE